MSTLHVTQRARIHALQIVGLLVACAFFITKPILDGRAHEYLELAGFGLAIICVAGRAWSILYVGAHKNRRLITAGPYSVTRNPLYFFSTIGGVGIGLIFGSLIAAAILGLVSYLILSGAAEKEAAHLRALFGAQYDAYARQTPLFWPRLSLYSDPEEVTFSTEALKRTAIDGLAFLFAFPVLEGIEYLQAGGVLPILLRVF